MGITSAKGVYLLSEDGGKYIDAIASWYTCMYGHCNDFITGQAIAQMQKLDQVVFSGFTHEPAIRLAEDLMEVLPDNQQKIFFSDNGSTSVEVAIKMALQFHFNKGEKRNVLLALEEGFHGDTFGAMSVSGLSVYNGPFEAFFIKVIRVPRPTAENLDRLIELTTNILDENRVAGFIYEPLVQGAAGMKMIDTESLDKYLGFLKARELILIADEVMTGFGKTGTCFASDQLKNKPDLMCLSKALTAGLLPMGITSCSKKIFEAFYCDEIQKGFFHAHTYTANPIACATAIAALELLRSDEIQNGIKMIDQMHAAFHQRVQKHPMVKDSRHLGVIYALDLKTDMDRYGALRDSLYRQFMDKGIYLRPLGNTIYIMPPYIIKEAQLNKIYLAIEDVLNGLINR